MPINSDRGLHERISSEFLVANAGEDAYRVDTPFQYDDGDVVSLHVRREGEFWRVSDGGDVFMRLSYRLDDKALLTDARSRMIRSALSLGDIELSRGVLQRLTGPDDLGEAIAALAQAALRIASVALLTQERVRSAFLEDVERELEKVVPSARTFPRWHDRRRDPDGLYMVDWRIEVDHKPLFLFALTSTMRVMDATISVGEFMRWEIPFTPVGVMESKKGISQKALRQFGSLSDKIFYSFPTSHDRFRKFVADQASLS